MKGRSVSRVLAWPVMGLVWIYSKGNFTVAWGQLSVSAQLFSVCPGSAAPLWDSERGLVGAAAHWSLSPVGRIWLRSRAPGLKRKPMKASDAAREILYPLRDAGIVLAMLVFWLLGSLAFAAGLLGLWLLIVIVPAFFSLRAVPAGSACTRPGRRRCRVLRCLTWWATAGAFCRW